MLSQKSTHTHHEILLFVPTCYLHHRNSFDDGGGFHDNVPKILLTPVADPFEEVENLKTYGTRFYMTDLTFAM